MISEIQGKGYILTELILLFVILPLLYFFNVIPFHKVIPLVGLFFYCVVILIITKRIGKDKFTLKANWKLILIRFTIIIGITLVFIWFFTDSLWADLTTNRKLLVAIIIYPVLSAFPQELIFREFFFYRYAGIFKRPSILLTVNVVLFSFAHLYFVSWIVLLFTLAGGLIFALTYLKTRSLLVVTIEHTLYGSIVLASGLGEQFYKAF
jgi:membrane protease YdiL (CAAX protease family)